jgi:hypothetical protein
LFLQEQLKDIIIITAVDTSAAAACQDEDNVDVAARFASRSLSNYKSQSRSSSSGHKQIIHSVTEWMMHQQLGAIRLLIACEM